MLGYGPGFGLGMGFFGPLPMLLFWLAVILLVVLAVRALFPSRDRDERETAVDVLKQRYAAGEIDRAEYEQARKALG